MPSLGRHVAERRDSAAAPIDIPTLVVPARAVLIAKDTPQQRAIKAALARRGVTAYLVPPDASNIFGMLDRDPRISVIGVRLGELGRSQHDRLLARIYDQPGLTTFAIGATRKAKASLSELGVSHFYDSSASPDSIADGVVLALSAHHFDEKIARALPTTLIESITDTSIELETLEPLVRVGGRVLGALSAITVIGGDDLTGRVAIAGPLVFFERLVREWLGKKPATKEMVWDAAGELCNRAAGLVRAHYAKRGLASRQATPTIIEGTDASIRGMTAKPGLVVRFESAKTVDPIHIELVLAWKGEDCEPEPVPETMVAGELTFL